MRQNFQSFGFSYSSVSWCHLEKKSIQILESNSFQLKIQCRQHSYLQFRGIKEVNNQLNNIQSSRGEIKLKTSNLLYFELKWEIDKLKVVSQSQKIATQFSLDSQCLTPTFLRQFQRSKKELYFHSKCGQSMKGKI